MDIPLVLSVIAIALSAFSGWTSVRSARASEKSAASAESSADAAKRTAEAEEQAVALQRAEHERTAVILSATIRQLESGNGVKVRIKNSGHGSAHLEEAVVRQIRLSFREGLLGQELMGGATMEIQVLNNEMRVKPGDEIEVKWKTSRRATEAQVWKSLL